MSGGIKLLPGMNKADTYPMEWYTTCIVSSLVVYIFFQVQEDVIMDSQPDLSHGRTVKVCDLL
jgi:hypothetical protein